MKDCHSFQHPLEGCKKQGTEKYLLKLNTWLYLQGTYPNPYFLFDRVNND